MPVHPLSDQEPAPTVEQQLAPIGEVAKKLTPIQLQSAQDDTLLQDPVRRGQAQHGFLEPGVPVVPIPGEITRNIRTRDMARQIILSNEGKVIGEHTDTKGNKFSGIGSSVANLNTLEEVYTQFDKDLEEHERRARKEFGSMFDRFHPTTRGFLVDSYFRGGLPGSPKTIGLIKEGKFAAAASEFLRNEEYNASNEQRPMTRGKGKGKIPGRGVARRMERFAMHLRALEPNFGKR